MAEEIKEFLTTCPKCGEPLQPAWSLCPLCGLRIKPEDALALRAAMWGAVLLGYVGMVLVLAKSDQTAAIGFAIVTGLPLAYVFGKALMFRLSGRPLTLGQLGRTSLRAGAVAILVAIVAPFVLGVACLLLLFAVCATGGAF